MSDDDSQGGGGGNSFSAQHPAAPKPPLSVAPTDGSSNFNTIRIPLIPVACWRLNDPAFAFDSSFVSPSFKNELGTLSGIVSANQGCPAALFGHCDPAGSDALNKTLGDRRAIAIYGLLTRQPDLWAYLYDNTQVGDTWDLHMVQTMLASVCDGQGNPYYAGSADGISGPETTDAVKRFQGDAGLTADGDPGPATRKALYGAYMDWLCTPGTASGPSSSPGGAPASQASTAPTPFRMQPTDFLGGAGAQPGDLPNASLQSCGKFNPIVLLTTDEMGGEDTTDGASKTRRNAADAPNRRVIMFLFEKGTTVDSTMWPCPKVKDPNDACKAQFWPDGDQRRQNGAALRLYKDTRDTMACRFYDRFARRSPCEAGQPRATILKFFARPAQHDDVSVEAHRVLVPVGTDVILHWETRRADKVSIEGMLVDGSTYEVALPNDGAQQDDGSVQRGQVLVQSCPTARFALWATRGEAEKDQFRKVDVVTYTPGAGDNPGLVLGQDTINLVPVPTFGELAGDAQAPDDSQMVAGPGGGGAGGGLGPLVAHAPDLLDFRVFDGPRMDFRDIAKQLLLSVDNFGLDDHPTGRREAYLDIVSWDASSRAAMGPPLTDKKSLVNASSCAMFVRMFWWLMGFRGDEMDMPWQSNTIITRLLKYAGSAARPAGSFGMSDFRPQSGDVLLCYASIDGVTHQHIFPIVQTSDLPDAGQPLTAAFTIFSVDGGSTGGGRDGLCNGVHRSQKQFNPSQGMQLNIAGRMLPVTNWFDLGMMASARMQSMATAIEVIRNKGNACLPADSGNCVINDNVNIP